jgi:hypothetical protein
MKLLSASTIIALSLASGSAASAEKDTVITGIGAASCGKFATAFKENSAKSEALYFSWAQGFMSSINFNRKMQNGTPIDFSAMPPAAQFSWIRSYCQKNPMRTYLRATTELFLALEQSQANLSSRPPVSE